MKIPETLNIEYLDRQYQSYQADPQSVSREWQVFFQGFDMGLQRQAPEPVPARVQEAGSAQVAELIQRYRDIGHLLACMDPLSACPTEHPLLALSAFELKPED